tara:strand:- start:143 stop:286 length:144 start_codon:yes stop_codon:yes gene_type:complete
VAELTVDLPLFFSEAAGPADVTGFRSLDDLRGAGVEDLMEFFLDVGY